MPKLSRSDLAPWIRNPSDDLALSEGCFFDPRHGLRVIEFLEKFCRQSKGHQWAGKPLAALPWQRDLLMRLHSWRKPDGRRRFSTCYLEIAKKNGKSTLLSGLGLHHLLADGEPAAEAYICAVDRQQASIIFDESSRMVRKSPALLGRLEVIPSRKLIISPADDSKLEAMSADVPSKDGINASLVMFDELHRQPGPAMYDVMKYAGAGRSQPLHVDITTAGEEEAGIWFERREFSEKVNAGLIPSTDHLGVIYRCATDDDLGDPEVWRKANPSLGSTIDPEKFAREYDAAKANPRELANFLRLRLGIVVSSAAKFIRPEAWAACDGGPRRLEALAGRPCYGGLDLSSTMDLTAYSLIFPLENGKSRLLTRIYAPEESAAQREREAGVPYRMWANQGFITLTPGNVVDYSVIKAQIIGDAERFEVKKICCDPWNATQLALDLQELGIPVEFLRQGYASISGPTKELERMILSGELEHDGNPCLAWAAGNAVTETDPAGNIKISKRKSRDKIDPIASTINAVAAKTSDPSEPGKSVYETRGLASTQSKILS